MTTPSKPFAVHYAAHIQEYFGPQGLTSWTSDIRAWQANCQIGESDFNFGKDSENLDTKFGVRHVHLLPDKEEFPSDYERWARAFVEGRPQVSDGCMIYAISPPPPNGQNNGLLVIDFYFHPGAHDAWENTAKNRATRSAWDRYAKEFRHYGFNIA